jgi:putative tryptophan/tyrosine transport system substrate-binding protein
VRESRTQRAKGIALKANAGEKAMRKSVICLTLCAMLLALCVPTNAQQPTKLPRIGYQSGGSSGEREEAFRQGLRELGYIEGQTIIVEWRFAEGKSDRVPQNAAELVRLKVDVIVTGGSSDTLAARKATQTIPIVMTQDSDPVGNGFVASLARPGGNITGLTSLSFELNGKRLELLKETLPRLSHVFVLQGPGTPVLLRERKSKRDRTRSPIIRDQPSNPTDKRA